ncbi:hypothetical protein SDC9_198357 [bioreactor metagenome]|uniref:Uncharacterized protein n=1 Tax=bioreactor metagenome TaxID=1076179 RepID=A0A645IQU3_9ZZZZ
MERPSGPWQLAQLAASTATSCTRKEVAAELARPGSGAARAKASHSAERAEVSKGFDRMGPPVVPTQGRVGDL